MTPPQLMILQAIVTQPNGHNTRPSLSYGKIKQFLVGSAILTKDELHRALKLLLHYGLLWVKMNDTDKSSSAKHGKQQKKKAPVYRDADLLVLDPRQLSVKSSTDSVCNVTTLRMGSSLEVLGGGDQEKR